MNAQSIQKQAVNRKYGFNLKTEDPHRTNFERSVATEATSGLLARFHTNFINS